MMLCVRYVWSTNLPSPKMPTELLMAIIKEPIPIRTPLAFVAPFLPHLSMITFAHKLPESPPTVKIAVMNEKVRSDMGIQVGRP